ncbi:MAG: O-antigen ligase family protein [Verrucomicrobiales bacterium]
MPPTPHRRLIQILLWVFCLSFAFDFRGDVGGHPAQYLFLLGALMSGFSLIAFGGRTLLAKPGIYILLLWWGYLGSTLAVAAINGVEFGRYARCIIAPLLCGLGIAAAHVSACSGLTARQIVTPLAVCGTINCLWRVAHGFLFKGVTIDTVRAEVLSPATAWIAGLLGVTLLFSGRLRLVPVAAAVAMLGSVFLSVTRGAVLPMAMSALACFGCLYLALRWRLMDLQGALRKLMPIGAVAGLVVVLMGVAGAVQPTMFERWVERLFHHADSRNIGEDVSWLSREAEAKAMMDLLDRSPIRWIYGHGIGGSYYWDPSYYPDLYLVYPHDFDFTEDFWFPGHSPWTYSLFSGGVLGMLCYAAIFLVPSIMALRSVWRNAGAPGFDLDLGFLPLVGLFCILSETATSNPFDERLAGLIVGMMAGLPQALFCRAHWARAASPAAQPAPASPFTFAHPA